MPILLATKTDQKRRKNPESLRRSGARAPRPCARALARQCSSVVFPRVERKALRPQRDTCSEKLFAKEEAPLGKGGGIEAPGPERNLQRHGLGRQGPARKRPQLRAAPSGGEARSLADATEANKGR
jgi:hypothetical protein